MKLSIAVITMNRCNQVIEALKSCISCKLPEDTEIIILDNASTDETMQKLEAFKIDNPQIEITIYHSDTNLGVGGGRNFLFDKVTDGFIYFMDDDAIIAEECQDVFFTKSVSFLDEHDDVASITTKIYDELLGESRSAAYKSKEKYGLNKTFIYMGGSHFLRKTAFDSPLYLEIKYGAEEYFPSISAIDKGFFHVVDNSIRIIHKPKINKWVNGSDKLKDILIKNSATVYATKRILYPVIFYPLLYLGYIARQFKYLLHYPGASRKANILAKELIKENSKCPKISFLTVILLIKDFGLSVL